MGAHGAVASKELDATLVQAVLQDWRTAPVDEKLRAMLALLEKVTRAPNTVTSSDVQPLLALGVSEQAIEDALLICACFNLISRLADAFGVTIPSSAGFALMADRLLARGYL